MGKRGPRPTPTAILKARGSRRADRNPAEPQPEPGRPDCPPWLPPEAKDCWAAIVPRLEQMAVLTLADRNALTRYCVLWARWREAETWIRDHGETYTVTDADGNPRGVQTHPKVAIAAKLSAQLERLEADFGLNPSARSRIVTTPAQTSPLAPDPKARFFSVVS